MFVCGDGLATVPAIVGTAITTKVLARATLQPQRRTVREISTIGWGFWW